MTVDLDPVKAPRERGNDTSRSGAYALIAICFLLSGFAALLYETVWIRQFAIILGTSEQALAVILASYMGGLSIGSWVASKQVDRITQPVWVYGVLEAGIALCAIAMPWGLIAVEWLQLQLFGGAAEPPSAGSFSQIMFGLVASFALIMPPTAMMGATLPLLAKYVVRRDRQVGPRIGVLYSINTFGAVAGTLAAAFIFLPRLGLARTIWVGAAINLGVFALVYVLLKRITIAEAAPSLPSESAEAELQSTDSAATSESDLPQYRLILLFAAAAGAVAFCYEIIFTRMLGHILGGSIYAFATMLAGFLLGIAFGGAIASRFAIKRAGSVVALVYAQSFAGIAALAAYHLIDRVAGWSFKDWGGPSATYSQVMISILILLPTATFIGATFPLATRIFARDQSEAASGSARVYLWNTAGGIVGALVAGIYLLPSLAYQHSTFAAVLLNAVLAMLLVWTMRARWLHLAGGLMTIVLLVIFSPPFPTRVMHRSALNGERIEGDLIFSQVGRSGTVALFDRQGDTRFFTNGLPEAIVGPRGSQDPFAESGAWLSALPPLIRPNCESMLIIGLGGGVAAAHVPPSVEEVDIFELEPAVVEANEFVRKRRSRDPLADPRVKIVLNDGRNGLALTSKKYDAIVSQPSHPWTAGASHLYTREFAKTVRQRLNENGVFLQWMNTSFMNPSLFRSLSATLLDVFPHVRVYEPYRSNSLFIASNSEIRPEAIAQPTLPLNYRDVDFYKAFGVQTATHLFTLLSIDEAELRKLSRDAPLITDEYNLLAIQTPHLLSEDNSDAMISFFATHLARNQEAAEIRAMCPTLDPRVLGLRLQKNSLSLDLDQARSLFTDDVEAKLYEAAFAKGEGDTDRWAQLLRELAAQDTGDPRAAFLLLAHSRLGIYRSLDDEEAKRLITQLDERHAALYAAADALGRNDLAEVQRREPALTRFSTDEVGYGLAVRMRLLWRIMDQGPNRGTHNREALDLIVEAIPSMGVDALIPFRVTAAIGAGEPEAALACASSYAKAVFDSITQGKIKQVSKLRVLRANLVKCRAMIGDPRPFESVNQQRYQAVVEYLDKVIAGE